VPRYRPWLLSLPRRRVRDRAPIATDVIGESRSPTPEVKVRAVARVWACALWGLETALVTVEVDVANGLPAFVVVGLPDAAVQEARERVRRADRRSGPGPAGAPRRRPRRHRRTGDAEARPRDRGRGRAQPAARRPAGNGEDHARSGTALAPSAA